MSLGTAHVGDKVDQLAMLKTVSKLLTKQGKPYFSIIFQDKTGECEGKLWDVREGDENLYEPGKIVHIVGEMQNYQGRHQLRVVSIQPAERHLVDMGDFVTTAPIPKEEMGTEIKRFLNEIKDEVYYAITHGLIKKYGKDFLVFPAATKNHHEFMSGLAFHVVSMLRLAKAICDLYPSLNRDLLYAGVILHDLGKVTELSGPVSTVYTIEGQLLGHISIMVTEIKQMAEELGLEGEKVTLLQHMVLSHHGKEEWGSPKKPQLKEAEMLHYIDNIDAKMNMMDRVLEKTKPGEFSERVFALENRSIYRPLEN